MFLQRTFVRDEVQCRKARFIQQDGSEKSIELEREVSVMLAAIRCDRAEGKPGQCCGDRHRRGGFMALEVATSAAKLAKEVTIVEASRRLLECAVSPILSIFLLDTHLRAGVDVSTDSPKHRIFSRPVTAPTTSTAFAKAGLDWDRCKTPSIKRRPLDWRSPAFDRRTRACRAGISPAPEQAADPCFDLKSLVTAGDKAGASPAYL